MPDHGPELRQAPPESTRPSGRAVAALTALLAATIALPPLMFLPGSQSGIPFVAYREPKLALLMALGWTFTAVTFWIVSPLQPERRDRPWSTRIALISSLGLLAYGAISVVWVTVRSNWTYEITQYTLLLFLLISLFRLSSVNNQAAAIAQASLVFSAAVMTIVGLAQFIGVVTWPPSIDPFREVSWASLMGYKNPMASFVVLQIFLLGGRVYRSASGAGQTARTVICAALLCAEFMFLLVLKSRTAMFAFAVGVVVAATVLMATSRTEAWRRITIALLLIVTIASGVAFVDSDVRQKYESVFQLIVDPSNYLETDRGVYLLNTLNMIRARPLGAGLGDWQTLYPVFRAVDRYRAFDSDFTVRRAHSDIVGVLGELGWPGLALLLLAIGSCIARQGRRTFQGRDPGDALLLAQLVAAASLMTTHSLLEHPVNKLAAVVLFALPFLQSERHDTASSSAGAEQRWVRVILTSAVTLLAVLGIAYGSLVGRKAHLGAKVAAGYRAASAERNADIRTRLLRDTVMLGDDFMGAPVNTKSSFRGALLVSETNRAVGRLGRAHQVAARALELAPYHPDTLRMMASTCPDPKARNGWERAAKYVMDEATCGFTIQYPKCAALRQRSLRQPL